MSNLNKRNHLKTNIVMTMTVLALLGLPFLTAVAQGDSMTVQNVAIGRGDTGYVPIYLVNNGFSVGGFSMRVVLEDSLQASIIGVQRGSDVTNFEYYHVRFNAGICAILAIANMPNGGDPPPIPVGRHEIARLMVTVSQNAPADFVDSVVFRNDTLPPERDNSISDSTGYISSIPILQGGAISAENLQGGLQGEYPLPNGVELMQNYPNPFNAQTEFSFGLPGPSRQVSLEIYDMLGREIREFAWDNLAAGTHDIIWDGKSNSGRPVSSGIYLYRLVTDGFRTEARRMTLIK